MLASLRAAEAQPGRKVYRIGYLTVPSRESARDGADAFQGGLRDLGWVEGQNVVVVRHCFADSKLDRLPDLAAELVRLRVDVITAGATPAVIAAKNATRTIPIVMFLAGNPVGSGPAASLARPGGNVTGSPAAPARKSTGSSSSYSKMPSRGSRGRHSYEWSHRVISRARAARNRDSCSGVGIAAASPGSPLSARVRHGPAGLIKAKVDAILVPADPLFFQHRAQLADLAAKTQLPAMWAQGTCGGWWTHDV